MEFVSTRGAAPAVPFSAALARGLAPDGGLYVPRALPRFRPRDLAGADDLPRFAARVLAPFLRHDALAPGLAALCAESFSFPIPLVEAPESAGRPGAAFLELFHGPTAAFKDVGARFLARSVAASGVRDLTVLVATSGDTGGAVAAAFHGVAGIEVAVLFPADGVSPAQRHQLTCWGDNVRAFAVRGSFDDCQAMLKAAFGPGGLAEKRRLTTANSINVARLLAQTVYFARAACEAFDRHGRAPSFVVPTGNAGNATAALWAKRMGFPLGRVVLATNANRVIPEYLAGGAWRPRPAVSTLANAMDVGRPSNMERIDHLYPTRDALREDVDALAVEDSDLRAVITRGPGRWGRVLDPHTAAAVHAVEVLDVPSPVVLSTAHPAKFRPLVEELTGAPVEVPASLARIEGRPERCEELPPRLDALRRALS